jgi:hypothetical protein
MGSSWPKQERSGDLGIKELGDLRAAPLGTGTLVPSSSTCVFSELIELRAQRYCLYPEVCEIVGSSAAVRADRINNVSIEL